MLQAADLVFGYGAAPVICGVSLDVPPGTMLGLIGPNGSGKTTLLRLLAGTRRPSRGIITLDGIPLTSLARRAVARRLATVPQDTHLAFDYTVLEVVLMGRHPHLGAFQIEGAGDIDIARAALAAAGAAGFERRLFSTLSGGERQRVVIAAALAQIGSAGGEPEPGAILLLDEPTAALDLKHQLGLARLLERLHQERRLTIVISTHDLAFAAALCTGMAMLKEGRLLARGSTADVLTAGRVRDLYDVDVDVSRHPATGRLVVVPVGPAGEGRLP